MKISHGLSLIEVTIVLVIIGLLLSGLLIPLSAQIDQQKIDLTKKRLEEIKEALLGFAIIYNRLPCPSYPNNSGIETTNVTDCRKEGYLPWKDLGIGRYDAWNNPFRYRADRNYTNSIVAGVSNKLRIRTIRYTTDAGDERSWLTNKGVGSSIDTRVAAIILSCGKNGTPDPTPPFPLAINYKSDDNNYYYTNDADGTRNTKVTCENNGTSWKQSDVYIQESYMENSFDDILTWLSKNTLMNRLVAAGKWPP